MLSENFVYDVLKSGVYKHDKYITLYNLDAAKYQSLVNIWVLLCFSEQSNNLPSAEWLIFDKHMFCIDGVMVSVLASSVVDRGVKPKTINLVFVASLLSTLHY
jgi:hypothetical protein